MTRAPGAQYAHLNERSHRVHRDYGISCGEDGTRRENSGVSTQCCIVGGGPAGMSAALAAARNGAKVALLERYSHLGGLASGGMVLVLDDMWDSHHEEISVRGTCLTMIERLARLKLATFPRQHEWGELPVEGVNTDAWPLGVS